MTDDRPTRGRWSWWPSGSRVGQWALTLFGLAVLAVLLVGLAAIWQPPHVTFSEDPLLAAPAALAAVCGTASAALGGYAIVRHERALLVFLSTAAALNILAYVVGEALRTG